MVRLGRWRCSCILPPSSALRSSSSLEEEEELGSVSTADWSFILDRRTPGGEGTRYLAGSRMVRLGRWSCSCLLTLPSVLQSSPSLVEEGELDSVSTADWSLRLDRRTPSVAGLRRPCTSSLKGSALSSASDRSNGQTDNKFLWIVLVRVYPSLAPCTLAD